MSARKASGLPAAPVRITAQAPAKLNLFLAVTDRRADGYHELISLMCGLDLCDTLHIELPTPTTTVACDHPQVPADGTNLAARAARLFFDALGLESGAHVRIDKRIPIGAGLGGGSSDAAAVLRSLNDACGNPFDRTDLRALAARLGADVPFFIEGRAALATGIGERLKPFSGLPAMPVVVVFPGVSVDTGTVYGCLNLRLTKCRKKIKAYALKDGAFDPARHLCNDLEAAATGMFPVISTAKQALQAQGAIGALMTGSGSAVFGLFRDPSQARRAQRNLARHDGWQSFAAQLTP